MNAKTLFFAGLMIITILLVTVGAANATVYINSTTLKNSYQVLENQTANINFKYYGDFNGTVNCKLSAMFGTTLVDLKSKGAILNSTNTSSSLGACDFKWTPGFKDAGLYKINFTVSDANSSDYKNTNLTVVKVNVPPQITSSAVLQAYANDTYSYQVTAIDANGDSLKYYVSAASLGSNPKPTISSLGLVSWIPNSLGTYSFTVLVSDGTINTSQTFNVNVISKPKFVVSSVNAYVDGYYQSISNGSTITVNPLSTVKFTFNLANQYTYTQGGYIRDVSIKVDVPGMANNGAGDLENDTSYGSIYPGGNAYLTVNLNVPAELNQGNYRTQITITADDSFGKYYYIQYYVYFSVNRKSNQLYISNMDVFPSTVQCGDTAVISADVMNIGLFDQSNAKVKIYNSQLGLDHSESNLDIPSDAYSSDSTYHLQYSFNIPKNTNPGDYVIKYIAYYSGSIQSDTESLTFHVNCPEPTPTPTPTPIPTPTPTPTPTVTLAPTPTKTAHVATQNQTVVSVYRETPFTESSLFIGILIGAAIGLAIIIILLLVIEFQIISGKKRTYRNYRYNSDYYQQPPQMRTEMRPMPPMMPPVERTIKPAAKQTVKKPAQTTRKKSTGTAASKKAKPSNKKDDKKSNQ